MSPVFKEVRIGVGESERGKFYFDAIALAIINSTFFGKCSSKIFLPDSSHFINI